jgi:hypothetical protein
VGRTKEPLPPSARYHELARWLRALRRRSGMTYRQMADRIREPGCSAATLSRADSGSRLPRRTVVEAYAEVCGASRREARARWARAARQTGRPSGSHPDRRPGHDAPGHAAGAGHRPPAVSGPARRLDLVYHPAHLLEAMHRLRLAAGRPSLRQLQERARSLGAGPLPRSTVADVLAGVRMPSEELLLSYALACGEKGPELLLWRSAWARALRCDSGPAS